MSEHACQDHGVICEGLQRIERKLDGLEEKILDMRSSMYGNGDMEKVKKSFAGLIQSCESRISALEKSRTTVIEYFWRYGAGPVIALLFAAIFRAMGL